MAKTTRRRQERFSLSLRSFRFNVCLLLFTFIPFFAQESEQYQQQQIQDDYNNNYGVDVNNDFVIAGYVPEYKATKININNTVPFLTDLILFSVSPHSLGFVGGCCLDVEHYELILKAKAYKQELYSKQKAAKSNNEQIQFNEEGETILVSSNEEDEGSANSIINNGQVRLWVSVGGAERSDHFAAVASDAKKIERFVKSLYNIVVKYNLDGIDLNWEFPTNMNEYQLYCKLIWSAAMNLRPHNILISVSTRNTFPKEIIEVVDRFHVMTYDLTDVDKFDEKYNYAVTKHHADMNKVKGYVNDWIKSGCPPSKIILGIPMYGRHMEETKKIVAYNVLVDERGIASDVDVINADDGEFEGFAYDSPKTIRRKVNYAKREQNLGGIFFWEIGQDKQLPEIGKPGGVLLQAAYDEASMVVWDPSKLSKSTAHTSRRTKSNEL